MIIMQKKILLIIVSVFFSLSVIAQTQKYQLSRQDSAKLDNLQIKAEEYKTNHFLKQESDCYNEIAMIWWEHNYFSKAVEFYNKSLHINNNLANENAIAMINSNLALIYADQGEYEKSLDYFRKTLNIRTIKNEKVGIIAARINMSVVLNNLKRYDESIEHLSKALDIAREMNDPVQMRSCYGMLSETYEKAGNNTKSYYYFELYREFNELVEGKKVKRAYKTADEERLKKELAEKENEIKELELIKKNYELIKKEKEIENIENEKLSLLDTLTHRELKIKFIENEAKLEKVESEQKLLKSKLLLKNIILISSIILLTLIVLLVFYIQKRKSNRILKRKNAEITQKNEEIEVQKQNIEELYKETSEAHESIKKSIDYAGIIQTTMINKSPKLSSYFPESFIYNNPKDVVGGDFYWYSKVNDKIIVAAVDCTGHGVPGAFLTVLGNNILNQIVNISKVTKPGEILFEMNKSVIQALNQESGNNKDGMDIALCTIDINNNKIAFAGANNPLVMISGNEMNIVKGDKYGIGGHSQMVYKRRKEFSEQKYMYQTHEFDFKSGTLIYLFSDGYQDQIGGENIKKLRSKNFYNILFENHTKTAIKQKEKLSEFYNNWKADNEQIDDVVVVGIKI